MHSAAWPSHHPPCYWGADCGEQSDIIGAMKKALGLERLVREHADRYPEEQLQVLA